MAVEEHDSAIRRFLKRCAWPFVAVFRLAKEAVKSLPLFVSVIFGVGWPVRGSDADPDPPKPLNTDPLQPSPPANGDSRDDASEKRRQDAGATNAG